MNKRHKFNDELEKKIQRMHDEIEKMQMEEYKEREKKKKANRGMLKALGLSALWILIMFIIQALDIDNNIILWVWLIGYIITGCIFLFNLIRWLIAHRYDDIY